MISVGSSPDATSTFSAIAVLKLAHSRFDGNPSTAHAPIRRPIAFRLRLLLCHELPALCVSIPTGVGTVIDTRVCIDPHFYVRIAGALDRCRYESWSASLRCRTSLGQAKKQANECGDSNYSIRFHGLFTPGQPLLGPGRSNSHARSHQTVFPQAPSRPCLS